MSAPDERTVGLGVCGLGRGFTLMLPTFARDGRFRLVAAAEPRAAARERFEADFGGPAYGSMAELCADAAVEAIYVASPHQVHAEHVTLAARAGQHVLVEKPLAITLDEGKAMVAAMAAAGVHMVVGPSHSFDGPYLKAREIIAGGTVGRLRMVHAVTYTDFLYRFRRPEELDTARGGGVVFSQGAHQVDIVRLLAGGLVETVRAHTGIWDEARPTESAYAALLTFAGGAFASLTYSGHGHFDTDEFAGWCGELGRMKDPEAYGAARRAIAGVGSAETEAERKQTLNYGHADAMLALDSPLPDAHEHFGVVIASCERADLRPMPQGVMVYGDADKRLEPVPLPAIPRQAVMDELYGAVVHGQPPLHSGAWGLATLEVCLAILESARTGREVAMTLQVPV